MQISVGSGSFIGLWQLEIYLSISYFNTAQSRDKAAFRFLLNLKMKKAKRELKRKNSQEQV